ncbi:MULTISPECIES: DUF4312 family protein [unclassified Photobacterium]|uniref:DUF4312 family protein n=1 Tax=unclassified Photobacterium TaxID=2628852 RepID=UPI001EE03E33|nr:MULTISPECIES: DUF4312 family protein [unclassified Photobacterium]MCG3865725.1 DUF4312 family protein [Photobacterium sp. Ph6]MCG3877226.1 DUF4312 family protein [Photobacterium sp. Ph5]
MKKSITTTVEVSGKGNTKQSAFSSALNNVQKTILKETNNVILRIEPVDVEIISAEHKQTTEKFMFFFLPREKSIYSITINVTVNITLIETDEINFKQI